MLIVESINSKAFENHSDRILVVANHGEKVVVEQDEDMGPFLSLLPISVVCRTAQADSSSAGFSVAICASNCDFEIEEREK